jgi:predicted nucleic acid-binding protein
VLVDTSVWIDHFRRRNPRLVHALESAQVATHPFVAGELCCGNLARRDELLGLLRALPAVPVIEHDEVLGFVTAHRLHGLGLGWIDMHLLASARLARLPLWTLDKRLGAAAVALEVAAD